MILKICVHCGIAGFGRQLLLYKPNYPPHMLNYLILTYTVVPEMGGE